MLKRIMEARGGNYEGLMDNSDHFFEVNFSVTTFEKVFYEKLDFRNAVTNDCLKISCVSKVEFVLFEYFLQFQIQYLRLYLRLP